MAHWAPRELLALTAGELDFWSKALEEGSEALKRAARLRR